MGLFDIVGDILGTNKSDEAIGAQQAGMKDANATLKYMYDTTRADNAPWLEAGKAALKDLQDPSFQKSFTLADFEADPGYAFRMAEGQKAIERSAASRGGLMGGATMKALTRFGQDTASQEYQNAYGRFTNDQTNRFNRLSSIAGFGQAANASNTAAGQNYGNSVAANQIGFGNAQAAAHIGQGNQNAQMANQAMSAAVLFSDRRLKTEIKRISKDELRELREFIKPFRYRYKNSTKHGAGDFLGVMAQDLEKSALGRTLVFTDSDGNKCIDLGRAVSLILASWAEG